MNDFSTRYVQQEPSGDGDEIMNAIRHVRPGNNFEPSFKVFGRSDVNGAARLDLYSWALVRENILVNIISSTCSGSL